jgi:hypothetical protein
MFSEKISNWERVTEVQRDSGFWGVTEVSVKLKQK